MNTRSNATWARGGAATAGSRALPLLVLLPLLPLVIQGILTATQRVSATAQAAASARPADDADLPAGAVAARRRSLEACRAFVPAGTPLVGTVTGGGVGDGPATCWAVEVTDARGGRPVARLLWQVADGRFMHLARPEGGNAASAEAVALSDARAARAVTLDWLRSLGAAEKGDAWKETAPAARSGRTFIVRLRAADGRKATAYIDAGSGLPSVVSLIPPRSAAERARNRPE